MFIKNLQIVLNVGFQGGLVTKIEWAKK